MRLALTAGGGPESGPLSVGGGERCSALSNKTTPKGIIQNPRMGRKLMIPPMIRTKPKAMRPVREGEGRRCKRMFQACDVLRPLTIGRWGGRVMSWPSGQGCGVSSHFGLRTLNVTGIVCVGSACGHGIKDVLNRRYQCAARDAMKAYGIALLVGSWLTVLTMWAVATAHGPIADIPSAILSLPLWLLFTLPTVAIRFWAPGLALSIPLFLFLHLLRLREWPFLTIAGAVLVFGVNYALVRDPSSMLIPSRIEHAAIMGIIGAATGFALWAIAYGRFNLANGCVPITTLAVILVLTAIPMLV